MINSLLTFHKLVDSIWNHECNDEEFVAVLQKIAQLKAVLWSADLMQAEEELRVQFFGDLQRIEFVARQVLQADAIREMNQETRTYYGYLYAFLCNYSNDLVMIYNEFPFQIPIHIACGSCDNNLHSVLVNPDEFNEKNTTTVIPTEYDVGKDGLNGKNEQVSDDENKEELYSESETPEGFGEKDCNEWDFFVNVMRMLDICEEKYLSGILRYLYGEHECSKCHQKESVILSYRRWFYENQPNYEEPKRELINWIAGQAEQASKDYNAEQAAFFYRMAVWYEKSRNTPDIERVYEYIISYYEKNTIEEHDCVRQIQYVLRELLKTDFEELKARAYNRVASACAFDYSNEDKNRWDLAWQANLKAVGIYQKLHRLNEKRYWYALNGLCLTVAEAGEGDIDLADELIQDYISGMQAQNGAIDDIGEAYNRLAYMWAEGAGDYEKCYAYFDKYLRIAKQIYGENSDVVADLYEELADYYEEDGNESKACELREQALEINVREMGQMYLLPPIFKGIAIMAAKVTGAIDEEDKFSRVMSAADTYLELGESYYNLELPDKAMDCCKKAEALYEWEFRGKIPNSRMAKAHKIKGDIYLDRDNEKQARKEYQEAIDICSCLLEISTYDDEIEECREILGEILEEKP